MTGPTTDLRRAMLEKQMNTIKFLSPIFDRSQCKIVRRVVCIGRLPRVRILIGPTQIFAVGQPMRTVFN
jgi:hypothetical protein